VRRSWGLLSGRQHGSTDRLGDSRFLDTGVGPWYIKDFLRLLNSHEVEYLQHLG